MPCLSCGGGASAIWYYAMSPDGRKNNAMHERMAATRGRVELGATYSVSTLRGSTANPQHPPRSCAGSEADAATRSGSQNFQRSHRYPSSINTVELNQAECLECPFLRLKNRIQHGSNNISMKFCR